MWLQDRCTARTDVMLTLPWGRTLHHELMRIVDAVAREVMSASVSNDCVCETPADCRVMSVKDFAFEPVGGKRVGMSLPTRLRQRQWMLGRVAHVLRLAPVLRTYHATWSAASIKRLASVSNASEAALAWVCPIAAELLQRQDMLRREFSISPTYFKANSKLLASFR